MRIMVKNEIVLLDPNSNALWGGGLRSLVKVVIRKTFLGSNWFPHLANFFNLYFCYKVVLKEFLSGEIFIFDQCLLLVSRAKPQKTHHKRYKCFDLKIKGPLQHSFPTHVIPVL